jgi:hypothetical protein
MSSVRKASVTLLTPYKESTERREAPVKEFAVSCS